MFKSNNNSYSATTAGHIIIPVYMYIYLYSMLLHDAWVVFGVFKCVFSGRNSLIVFLTLTTTTADTTTKILYFIFCIFFFG